MPGKPLIYQDDTIVASPAAAAETVVCRLRGVASRYGNAVKLSGWVNVTPDTDATAIVLRVRRGTTTGGTLVTPAETVGFGASAGGGAVLGQNADLVFADASTVAPMDNAPHFVVCAIAAPPTWLDNVGNIIAPGLYAVYVTVETTTPATVPGLFATASGAFDSQLLIPVDGATSGFAPTLVDVGAVGAADLPWNIDSNVLAPADVTGVLTALPAVAQLASVAGASGGGVTPGDAVLDVIDLPGQIAQASYVLTAQMTGANSPSVINGVSLTARID